MIHEIIVMVLGLPLAVILLLSFILAPIMYQVLYIDWWIISRFSNKPNWTIRWFTNPRLIGVHSFFNTIAITIAIRRF